MKKKFIRRLSALLSLALIITLVAPVPAMAASGGKLVKSVKTYTYREQRKWNSTTRNYDVLKAKYEISSKRDFKYKNSYPSEIQTLNYSSETGVIDTLSYKMKKNLPKSMKYKNSLKKVSTKNKYNKKGLLVKSSYSSFFKRTKETEALKYNKNAFVTSFTTKYSYKNIWGTETRNSNYVYKYTYKMKKGLPKDLVSTYTYSSSYKDSLDPDDSGSSSGTGTPHFATYNSKGLITSAGSIYDGKRYVDYTVKYKSKKGVVTSAVVNIVDENNENGTAKKVRPTRKYSFSYAKEKIAKGRYANMINSMLGFGDSYGVYKWY